jgi:hypothetical protein
VVKKTTDATVPDQANVASQSVIGGLDEMNRRLTELLQPFTGDLQTFLNGLEGRSFGLAANKAIIAAIQGLLQRLGLRVRCPHCAQPAIPRCRPMKNTKGGSFQFEHSRSGKQTNHGGGTTFPAFKLVPAPPDRRRKRKKRT